MSRLFDAFLFRSGLKNLARRFRRMLARRRISDPALIRKVKTHNDFFFRDLGVTRQEAEEVYERANADIGLAPSERTSVHRLCFAALAASGFKPKSVLEIGTSFGATTAFLATVFPGATIYTLDLPEDDPILKKYHPEANDDKRADLLKARLSRKNIVPIRKNSVHLMTEDLPTLDLVWLDGGHFYPEVAWDHFYCMGRLNTGGWLFTDDIVQMSDRPRGGSALDAWSILQYFNDRFGDQFQLLLKRENVLDYLLLPKYIGCLKKTS